MSKKPKIKHGYDHDKAHGSAASRPSHALLDHVSAVFLRAARLVAEAGVTAAFSILWIEASLECPGNHSSFEDHAPEALRYQRLRSPETTLTLTPLRLQFEASRTHHRCRQ